ncbi:hypothetical protein NH287_08800 [Microbacterium sp. CnD16-F]|uniref:DUF6625 family protein n=1 Tax=Microbacterium sp. CnD16-F TaxID=2954493 RepID=UPI0020970E89|nr:DUF6625 family protein [Microbacterium sp. CnD16-F]MCO7203589.1 hypothetical protein [Microbacterium sp. CnD16-F]
MIVLLPYFGPFPSTWPLTLRSMERNVGIDWMIFSDQEIPSHQAANVSFCRTSLVELQDRFSKRLGFDVQLPHPYKLCDFKPAYGELFEKEIESYDYWGYCDADVVFGDLASQISGALSVGPEKIFRRGHLSFVRNTPEANSRYRVACSGLPDYRTVFQDETNHAFDEIGGMYERYERLGIHVYENDQLFDIGPDRFRVKANSAGPVEKYYVYRDGRMLAVDGGSRRVREGRYIHLQKRAYADLPEGWDSATMLAFAPSKLYAVRSIEEAVSAIRHEERSLQERFRWFGRYARRRVRGLQKRFRRQ